MKKISSKNMRRPLPVKNDLQPLYVPHTVVGLTSWAGKHSMAQAVRQRGVL